MALQSPGIELKENTTQITVVQNATGRAAMAGKFQWGPAFQVVQVTNEVELADVYGQPDNSTADYFINGANFLSYGNDLRVVRVVNEDFAKNASPLTNNIEWQITATGSNYAVGDTIRVKYTTVVVETEGKVTSVDRDGKITGIFIPSQKIIAYAKSIGQFPDLSDSWTTEIVSAGSGISGAITIDKIVTDSGIILTDPDFSRDVIRGTEFQDKLKKYKLPAIVAIYPGEIGDQLEVEIVSKAGYDNAATETLNVYPFGGQRASTAKSVFGYGPQNDSEYAFIVRRNGVIVENTVLSTDPTARDIYNSNIYMDDYFSRGASRYIFASAMNWPVGFNGVIKLSGGVSANDQVTAGNLMMGWDKFADSESIFVNLLVAGACAGETDEIGSTVQKHVVAIADERKDCTAMVSPPRSTIVGIGSERGVDNLIDWRTGKGAYDTANMNISSTYVIMDANYKYQYDKYNDVNRWVPLAGDIAGLCARTDNVSQPWMSPAGINRGQILNCVKLALETRQPHRDRLYQEGMNAIIGTEGFALWGDKTATKIPSPFDRINVRRLFNMLKKNIGDSSKYRLFELNNAFTRNSFRMETSQYLAGIKALGGIYDYQVICDTTNNTTDVIDRNEFVATFRIKPARSINYITLNFVATSTGTDFEEVVGGAIA